MVKCDNCGTIKYVLLSGYEIGDILLEGIFFRVRYTSKGKVSSVRVDDKDKEYFSKLNTKEWLKVAKDFAEDMNDGECPECGETVYLTREK